MNHFNSDNESWVTTLRKQTHRTFESSPFVERDWLLSLLTKSGLNNLLDLVFSLSKFQHHDSDSKQFLYFGDGVVWVESLQASWANEEKMQNSVEGFAVDGMLNMMMNNGNKVLSRIKIEQWHLGHLQLYLGMDHTVWCITLIFILSHRKIIIIMRQWYRNRRWSWINLIKSMCRDEITIAHFVVLRARLNCIVHPCHW